MEQRLQKIIFNKWFIAISHIFILFLIVYNISYLNRIQECTALNQTIQKELDNKDRKLKQLSNLEAYENSQLYQSKQMRERNYRLKDEQIIDVSRIEEVDQTNDTYTPQIIQEKPSNPQQWVDIFQGESFLNENVSCS